MTLLRLHITLLLCLGGILLLAQGSAAVDSLLATWPVQQRMQELRFKPRTSDWPTVDTDALYPELSHSSPALPVFRDSLVDAYANLFAGPRRDAFRALLGMAHVHFHLIEKELARHGLPNELKYLTMALSAMNAQAYSNTGEAGLWMLPWPVAMRYGLTVTSEVDERRDPVKSTDAAMHYLQDLQGRYGDWHTTVMAFCCGPANLTRARQRCGGDNDPRVLYGQFSVSHRDVLPLLMAFVYLSEHARELGLSPLSFRQRDAVDIVQHDSTIALYALAQVMDIPEPRVRAMNPSFIGPRIPSRKAFALPRGEGERFEELAFVILEAQRIKPRSLVVISVSESESIEKLPDGREAILYRITTGDCIGCIADQFGLGVEEIKAWNELESDQIDVGNTLMLYVTPEQRVKYEANGNGTAAADSTHTKPAVDEERDFSWYTVRSGDSLYLIAKRYPGVSSDDLMRFNRIGADIRPGQRVKIPKR